MILNRFLFGLLLLLNFIPVKQSFAQDISDRVILEQAPVDYQIYQRDSTDNCYITIKGRLVSGFPLFYKKGTRAAYTNQYEYSSLLPIPLKESKTFELKIPIPAEMREWKIEIYSGHNKIKVFDGLACGDVYAVLGQSNATSDLQGPNASYQMNGAKFNIDYSNKYARALGQGIWGLEANVTEEDWYGWGPSGSIYYDLHHSGGWPLKLQHDLINKYQIPIGIVNAAFSGSSIEEHFSNSASVNHYDKAKDFKHKNPKDYNLREYFLKKLERAGIDNNIKYIFWYQGETDVPSTNCTSHYYEQLEALIAEWNIDFPKLEEVFLFQLNSSCINGINEQAYYLREAQRKIALDIPNVHLIPTVGVSLEMMSGDENSGKNNVAQPCHFNRIGMEFLAERCLPFVGKLVYDDKSINVNKLTVNQIQGAQLKENNSLLELAFEYPVFVKDSEKNYYSANIKDYFFDQDFQALPVDEMIIEENKISLKLSESRRVTKVSIYPGSYYHNTRHNYYGPWLYSLGQVLPVAFFSDFTVEQGSPSSSKFSKTWSEHSDSSNTDLILSKAGKLIIGNFDKSDGDEVLVVNDDGAIAAWKYNGGKWQLDSMNLNINQDNSTFLAGDFLGLGSDQLLSASGKLNIFGFAPKLLRYRDVLSKSTIDIGDRYAHVGNFDEDNLSELLLISPDFQILELVNFEIKDSTHFKWDITPIETPSSISWMRKSKLVTGDFNHDGQDEVLAFGEGAVLSKIIDNKLVWIWSASQGNHLNAFKFPIETNESYILSADIDSAHSGDELMIITQQDHEQSISVHAFNPQYNLWSNREYLNGKDPNLGDWPLSISQFTNDQYDFVSLQGGKTALLKRSNISCGANQLFSAALFEFSTSTSLFNPDLADLSIHRYQIYPNPNNGNFRIESYFQTGDPVYVSIVNSVGAQIYHHREIYSPSSFTVDLSNYSSGIYIISIESSTGYETQKFIIHN